MHDGKNIAPRRAKNKKSKKQNKLEAKIRRNENRR